MWLAKMRQAFAGFDINGNGYITTDDLDAHKARIAEAFGYTSDSAQYAEFAAAEDAWSGGMMSRLDKSGDDQISLDEWLEFWSEASDDDIAAWTDKFAAAVISLAASDEGLTKDEYVKFALATSVRLSRRPRQPSTPSTRTAADSSARTSSLASRSSSRQRPRTPPAMRCSGQRPDPGFAVLCGVVVRPGR
jgi:hypothetical protein